MTLNAPVDFDALPDELRVMPAVASANVRIEYMPLEDLALRGAARNPKEHDLPNIILSIERFGFVQPATVDERTGRLVAGHGRRDALIKMRADGKAPPLHVPIENGHWMMPVVRGIAFPSDAEAESYSLADNRLVEKGGFRIDLLAEMLSEFNQTPEGMRGLGWNEEELEEVLALALKNAAVEDPPEDAEPDLEHADELQAQWNTALGQLWLCDSKTNPGVTHRILCGDCTNPADMQRLMGKTQAHIVWTDPPWNVNYGADEDHPSWKPRTISNDNLGDKFPDFCRQFMLAIKAYTLPGAALYLAMSGQEWPVIDKAIRDVGFHWSSTIIWAKDSLVLSRKDYHTQYEPLWYGWLDGEARLHPLDDRTQSDLWQIDRPKRSDDFPIMKPIELVERALKNSSVMGEDVLDPFLGSGTTIVACERLGRRGLGSELDPATLAVVLKRLQDIGLSPRLEVAG